MKEVISTKNAPGAIGPYSQGIIANGFVFTSGQLPIVPETGELIQNDIKKAAAQCIENLKAILVESGTNLDNVVKTVVYLKDISDFTDVNEVYATYFTKDCPARSCFQVAKLPRDAAIEIEAIATK